MHLVNVNPELSPKITLGTIARIAGVSRSTASFILNDHSEKMGISPQTRDRVLATARSLNYSTNHFARVLRGMKTKTIGVLWSFAGVHSNANLIRQFSELALERDYVASLFDSFSDEKVILRALAELHQRRVDGIILQTASTEPMSSPLVEALRQFAATTVISRQPRDCHGCDCIYHSSERALEDLSRHLTGRGRRHLGILGDLSGNRPKVDGMEQAWSRMAPDGPGITFLNLDQNWQKSGAKAVTDMLSQIKWGGKNGCDALLCTIDEIAVIAMQWFSQCGIRVPDTVAVSGFNNSELAPILQTPLASVDRSDVQLADQAMEFIFSRLDNALRPPQKTTIEMSFVPRLSTG